MKQLIRQIHDELDTAHAEDSHKIIWEYEKEKFRDRYIKLKAEWSMLG